MRFIRAVGWGLFRLSNSGKVAARSIFVSMAQLGAGDRLPCPAVAGLASVTDR